MKFNIIHQPRRSGKTLYAIRKAYDNLINGKSTLILPLEEKEFLGQMINYLNHKKVKYYLFGGTIVLESNFDKPCIISNGYAFFQPHIMIINSKELRNIYQQYKNMDEEDKVIHKMEYQDILFDDVYNNFFKKTEDIYKMLNTICYIRNTPEVRFTYKIDYNQKNLELKQLKWLIDKYIITYKEIQPDSESSNMYEELKDYYRYNENTLPYDIEVNGKLLNTFICKNDMTRRKELLEIIATSDREDIIHNAKEELRDMEV